MTGAHRVWWVGELTTFADASFASLDALRSALQETDVRIPVTVVAPAAELTFDALEALVVASPGLPVSVIPAEDAHRLTDPPPRSDPLPRSDGAPRWAVYDALRRQSCASSGEDTDLADLFTQSWDLLGLVGHGDGSHLNLGSAVLCGLDGEHEETRAGEPTGGCGWEPPTCKKQTSTPVVFQSGRLRTGTLALFSCTSVALAQQVYPSNVSLALAAYRAGTLAVIGATRQVQFTSSFVADALDLMGRRPTLGEVVATLNANRRISEDGAIVLLGHVTTAAPAAAARAARTAVTTRWPAGPRRVTPSLTYVTVPRDAVRAIPDLNAPLDSLTRLAARLTGLDNVLRGLLWLARPSSDDAVRDHLARAEAARVRAIDAVQRERVEILRGLPPSERTTERRTQALCSVQARVLELLRTRVLDESHSGGGVGDVVAPALALFHDRDVPAPDGESCGHCGGALRHVALLDPVVRGADRRRTTCAACGILADTGLLRFRLVGGGPTHPGVETVFTVELDGDVVGPARGLFQVRDKTRPTAFAMKEFDIAAGARLGFVPPEDAGRDIWSARLVTVVDGAIEYARCVFAVTPAVPSAGNGD